MNKKKLKLQYEEKIKLINKFNQSYYDKKWFNESKDHAYDYPFGQNDEDYIKLDLHKSEPHSDKWLPLGYPPYPIEHEVNRFWEQLTKNST